MSWDIPPLVSRLAALSILFLVTSGVFSLGETVIADPIRSLGADVKALSERLANIEASKDSVTLVAKRQFEADQELHSLKFFWSGSSRPQIAASIQDALRVAAQQSAGRMVTTSVVEDPLKSNLMTIHVRIDGTISTLQSVLSTIEQSRPRLLVSYLAVTAVSASTLTQPQVLSFELSIDSYVAANDHPTL